jgi:hypothetical protein
MDEAFEILKSQVPGANEHEPADPFVREDSELVRRRRAHQRKFVATVLSLAVLVLIVVTVDGDGRKAFAPLVQLVARLVTATS